jgi:hypothetical protein
MGDLLILRSPAASPAATPAGAVAFVAADDPADRLLWWEPAPDPHLAGALCYRALLRLGAEGVAAPFLYIVEQDAAPEHEAELNAWYAEEHLPRLGAVPGVLSARRFAAVDASTTPRYLAAYRLTARPVFESPAWLEARQTPWTLRARGFFRNARRTMRRLEGGAG